MLKKFDLDYINKTKADLGYDPNSLNITIRNNGASFGKVFLFGYLAIFTAKFFNLSLEKDGLLFIQRGTFNNNLLKDKTFFISHDAIQDIKLKKGPLSYKMTLIDSDNKKTHFRINKILAGVPWHKESLAKLVAIYG
ncbi:hypothetical protein [Streptococcus pseudoporcinus]|uniref:YokE-like PH domain-containing protein n=2 Tax=Streptococcus pseudoporcinus TaxID=361101 RepID=G5KAB2_9STRE|nr:hypothetical protein [Streptococcus pseudoporcinus]EFR43537.1 hypothetical protein HMPREF9320_1291 [Streptococcus pseudoporcinus SPIN 20026]EHI65289.1 hypothetical protein STRPS_0705 [Streptococcus pseudoporcinus LQ 940-04]VEF93636.1 Uncharacterised protein [Streptococcus pseudoporcinus]VTS40334.1 Uncharacterised protein [Streptococcus pseudoporcinus]